jgi:hypothetical protein
MSELLLDAAGRRRSPATLPEFHAGRPPRNKGMRYPADPPTIEEIVTVMRSAGESVHGRRLRGLIVVLWRAGLRICEALALAEADLGARRGSLLVRRGKGGRRREVGMDDWAWEQLAPWLSVRAELPVGPTVLRRQRPDARTPLGGRRRPHRATTRRPRGRRTAPLCAAPTAPRARGRDGPRGRAADRHPAPARAHQPRHHLDLSARHRQHRDHRHRPCPPRADGPRTQLARAITPRPAAGKLMTSWPPVLVQITSQEPGSRVARRMLRSSPSSNPARRKQPAPFARRSAHAAIRLSCASRRKRESPSLPFGPFPT